MNRFLSFGAGLLLCLAAWLYVATSYASHQAGYVGFDGEVSNDFLNPLNWSDDNPPLPDGDLHNIENNQTAVLTGVAAVNAIHIGDESVGTLNVGAGGVLDIISDVTVWPHASGYPTGLLLGGKFHNHTGHGTLNITDGGIVNVIRDPDAPAGHGADVGYIGERGDGVLNIGPGSFLNSPEIVWRIGQFGGIFGAPPPFTAEGIVNVEGTFSALVLYPAPTGGASEITVSGNGSIIVGGQLHSSTDTFRGTRSSIMRMVGSNATWTSGQIVANTQDGEVRNHFMFVADSGGVSEMTTSGSMAYNNAELTVDLTAYGELNLFEQMRLFDAAPEGLSHAGLLHQFGVLNVLDVTNPAEYTLIYDDAMGDILLTRIPEPSSLALFAIGLALVLNRRR